MFDRVLDGKSDIWTVPVKGGAPTNITPGSPLDEFDPSLSRSGVLAFDATDETGATTST